MKRFSVIKDSKFEQMSLSEMSLIAGGIVEEAELDAKGICISCMKRARKFPIGLYGATCK